jgi:hypothetical protein
VQAERRHRQERLAGAFRLFARFGFAQGLAGHITARDPELTDHFWVNPLGIHFSRIKVSDLLLVNSKGETVIGDRPLNKAAFAIHAAIHEHNPKIIAAAHTHSTYGKAWSTLGRKLDTLTQDAACSTTTWRCSTTSPAWWSTPAKASASRRRWATGRARSSRTTASSPRARRWRPPRGGTSRSTTPATRSCWPKPPAQPQPIDEATARHTHGQIGGPEGAIHSFDSLYEGLVEAEPELLL